MSATLKIPIKLRPNTGLSLIDPLKIGGTQSPQNKQTSLINFVDLANTGNPIDLAIFVFVDSLLKKIFGKSNGEIIIDKQFENDINHQIIKDNWEFIELIFNVPKTTRNHQKSVRQTIKSIIEQLNQRYSFQKPLQFNSKKISTRNGKVCSSYMLTSIII